jgi:hypothetical protein
MKYRMFCGHSNKTNPSELHFQQLVFSKALELSPTLFAREETFRKVVGNMSDR